MKKMSAPPSFGEDALGYRNSINDHESRTTADSSVPSGAQTVIETDGEVVDQKV